MNTSLGDSNTLIVKNASIKLSKSDEKQTEIHYTTKLSHLESSIASEFLTD